MAKATKLTPKQQEVYDRLISGHDVEEVAKSMGISVNGVYQHKRRIEQAGYGIAGLGSRREKSSGRRVKKGAAKPKAAKTTPKLEETVTGTVKISVEDHVMQELEAVREEILRSTDQITALNSGLGTLEARRGRLEAAAAELKVAE